MAFDDRIVAHARVLRNLALRGNQHTLAGAVVFEAVIAALDEITRDRALTQWEQPMTTAIFHRADLPALIAPEHDLIAANGASQ
jgi:hypothetical protein